MKRSRSWFIGLVVLAVVGFSAIVNGFGWKSVAQSPSPSPMEQLGVPVAPIPIDPSLPANRPPLPGASPAASPSPKATPTAVPSIPPSAQPPEAPLPAAPTAPPLPLGKTYKDPGGRFRVGILKGFKVSPLAGSVLMESEDGNLAYTVQVQPQSQSDVPGGSISNDALVKIVQNVFKQGEGFETGELRSTTGGLQIDWTGNLTIAGKTQPIGGVIITRQAKNNVLLLLVAATEAGGDQVLGAASALVNSLQPL